MNRMQTIALWLLVAIAAIGVSLYANSLYRAHQAAKAMQQYEEQDRMQNLYYSYWGDILDWQKNIHTDCPKVGDQFAAMTYEQLVTITTSNHAKDDMKRLECALAHRELLAGKQNLQQLCADERMRIFCSQKEALHGKP